MHKILVAAFMLIGAGTASATIVHGVVRDQTGATVEGALLTFVDEDDPTAAASVLTGADGAYQLDLSAPSTAVLSIEAEPTASALFQNYPNPFNPETIIAFQLETPQEARLVIYNALGQVVRTLVDQPMAAGLHRLSWNATDDRGQGVAAGTYFYQLVAGDFVETGKMALLDGHKGRAAAGAGQLSRLSTNEPQPASKALEEASFYTVNVSGDGFFDYTRSGVTIDEDRRIDVLVNSSSDLAMIRLGLTDAPVDDAESVLVTISTVSIRRAGGGPWETFVGESRTFDLLDLTGGVNEMLGEQVLEPGEVTGVRLIVESAQIVIDGETFDLEVPSGEQRGIQLQGSFTVAAGETLELMLDFDARKSIRQRGQGNNYAMQPVLRLVQTQASGFIAGRVFADGGEEGIQAAVIATQDGEEVSSAIVDPEDGTYRISYLEPGTYDLHLETELSIDPSSIEGVEVTARRGARGVDFGQRPADDDDADSEDDAEEDDGDAEEDDGDAEEGDDDAEEGDGDAEDDDGDDTDTGAVALSVDNAADAWGDVADVLARIIAAGEDTVPGLVSGESTVDTSVGLSGITYVITFGAMSDAAELAIDGELTIQTADGEQFDYEGEITLGGGWVGTMEVDLSGTTDGSTGTIVVEGEELVIE